MALPRSVPGGLPSPSSTSPWLKLRLTLERLDDFLHRFRASPWKYERRRERPIPLYGSDYDADHPPGERELTAMGRQLATVKRSFTCLGFSCS
jgi:hypothetical protein